MAASLGRNFTIVGAATLASRLTGFLRDMLVAAVLGAGPVADAYVAAFLIPNLFRRIIGEGAFNAATCRFSRGARRKAGLNPRRASPKRPCRSSRASAC